MRGVGGVTFGIKELPQAREGALRMALKAAKGKANPQQVNDLLKAKLAE